MRRFTDLLKRFRRDEGGAFMILFAVMALVLIATSGAVVDFTYMQTARSRAQTALDSAALALQAHISDTNAEATITSESQQILDERLADSAIAATITDVDIDAGAGRLTLQASITVPTAFVQLVGIHSITAHLTSEALRGSSNLEVSVALDVTKSMDQPSTKIAALRTATGNLIDDLVQTSQTPTYSRMALVPYSYGVNVGTSTAYGANVMRGEAQTVTASLSKEQWYSTSKTMTSIAVAKNGAATVTLANHGLSTGDRIYISGISSSSSTVKGLNDDYYTITVPTVKNNKNQQVPSTDTFTLDGVTGGNSAASGTGGKFYLCLIAKCEVKVTTTANNTFKTGDGVYLSGISSLTNVNSSLTSTTGWFITVTDSKTFSLNGSTAAKNIGSSTAQYASGTGGTATRANYGDIYYHFTNKDGSEKTFAVSNCVTERPSPSDYAFTDDPPGTKKFNFMYPSAASNCVSKTILPLTSVKSDLHNIADNLKADGSTAGHIGLAWAWYMLSPKFTMWPTAPAAYKANNLIKALILMTDGAFNTAYCNGVVSQDSDTISGTANMIACNAPDGDSISQAKALCTSIKSADTGIVLYTVGFDIGTGDPKKDSADDIKAQNFLSGCATDPTHFFFLAQTAADLEGAFSKIAQNLNNLRLSK